MNMIFDYLNLNMIFDYLNLNVYRSFRQKGEELKRAGLFSEEGWTEYIHSVGCKVADKQSCARCGKTHTTQFDDRMIVFRDEHFVREMDGTKYYDRMIVVDYGTAMKIATLGLP